MLYEALLLHGRHPCTDWPPGFHLEVALEGCDCVTCSSHVCPSAAHFGLFLHHRSCRRYVTMTRRAYRLLALLEPVRAHPISTAMELSTALEVSVRTVYRDIEALVSTGVPFRGEAGVGYVLDPGYHLPPLNLTAEEAEALAFGVRVLATWSDGAVAAQAAAALVKIRAVLPASGQAGVDQEIFWALQWVTCHAPNVDLLEIKRAAQQRRVLRIEYETLNGIRSTRTIRPLAVTFFGPVWLFVAWCEAAANFRCFRLDRIGSAKETGMTFRNKNGKRLADFKRSKGEQTKVSLAVAPGADT